MRVWLNVNTLRPRPNGRHFADDIFKCIFLNENVWIPIKISMKFVPKGPINNIPSLVQIMAWHRPGDKPLSEPMMVCLTTHICVTRPQWVNQITLQSGPTLKKLQYIFKRIVSFEYFCYNKRYYLFDKILKTSTIQYKVFRYVCFNIGVNDSSSLACFDTETMIVYRKQDSRSSRGGGGYESKADLSELISP